MTDVKRFFDYMRTQGFAISDNFTGTFSLIPKHRVNKNGTHTLIYSIMVVNFKGINTLDGELGCVTFCYNGVSRLKYHKDSYQDQILKKAFCPKTVEEAIEIFDKWREETSETLDSWKVIL